MSTTLTATDSNSATAARSGRWRTDWDPEDPDFWQRIGRRVARRNLISSIFAEHLGFSIWTIWSVVVVALPPVLFPYTLNQKFWLVALPNLVGAIDAAAVHVRGYPARRSHLDGHQRMPSGGADRSHGVRGVGPAAVLGGAGLRGVAGFGGGNFASSMTNISFFFPERQQRHRSRGQRGWRQHRHQYGATLGADGDRGRPGVRRPDVAATGAVGAAFCAYRFMDDLAVARTPLRDQFATLRRPHTWIMSVLYIGTFGSFLGYSAAFPLVLKTTVPARPGVRGRGHDHARLPRALAGLAVAAGRWLAGRPGRWRPGHGRLLHRDGAGFVGVVTASRAREPGAFLAAFWLLFLAAGAGNGSTYRMIPAIFASTAPDLVTAKRESAATLGIAGAIGAVGGFYLPRAISDSYTATGGITTAFTWFTVAYAAWLALTWWCYLRRRVLIDRVPSLAHAVV